MRRPLTTTPIGRRALRRLGFQTEFPVVCRRTVHWSTGSFKPGELFPWKELGATPRKMQLLFRARKLRHANPEELAAMEAGTFGETPAESNTESTSTETETDTSTDAKRADDGADNGQSAETESTTENESAKEAPEALDLDSMTLNDLRIKSRELGVSIKPTKPLQLAAIKAHINGE